jgi:hypothetical protein
MWQAKAAEEIMYIFCTQYKFPINLAVFKSLRQQKTSDTQPKFYQIPVTNKRNWKENNTEFSLNFTLS